MWGVGDNTASIFGDGTSVNKTIPIQIVGLSEIIAISAGLYHVLFLKGDGTVWAIGGNYYGQVGNQPLFGVDTPTQITGLDNIIQVSAGVLIHCF